MKILVTGAGGLLGAHLIVLLSRRHEVTGTDRHPWWGDRPATLVNGELADPAFMEELVKKTKPDCLIHCAAITNVDLCERDPALAHAMNAEVTRRLARAVSPDCLFVYISTDGLFQGNKPMVTEEEPHQPRTVYGKSKGQGEREVQLAGERHLIIRTNFYGWSSGRKKTFVEWLYESLRTGSPITLFDDFFFTPIYVADLVENLAALIEDGHQGVFHLVGGERLSKCDFGKMLAGEAGFSTRSVTVGSLDQAQLTALRPKDMSLDSSRFCRETGRVLPDARAGVVRFLQDHDKPLSQRFQKECSVS